MSKTLRRPTWMHHLRQPKNGRLRLQNHATQYVILLDGLLRHIIQETALHGVLALDSPARRGQSGRGRNANATDSREQPSATQAPGAEQETHTSSGNSESGEVKD
ncbi:MAG: hypothetical protein ACKPKO_54920, partial [Candidatus Fonsibacter sp.]